MHLDIHSDLYYILSKYINTFIHRVDVGFTIEFDYLAVLDGLGRYGEDLRRVSVSELRQVTEEVLTTFRYDRDKLQVEVTDDRNDEVPSLTIQIKTEEGVQL